MRRKTELLSLLILSAALVFGCGQDQGKFKASKDISDISELPDKSVTADEKSEEDADGESAAEESTDAIEENGDDFEKSKADSATLSGESVDVADEISAQTRAEDITLELNLNEKLELMVSGYEDITGMVKYFPGGDSLEKADHAGELPVSHASLMALRDMISESYPDLPLGAENRIMMNHTCYPKISTELEPAFMSDTIVTSILREEMDFDGVIYTPSLCDAQLRARYMVDTDEHLAVEAVKAGCDVVYQPRNKKKTIEALRTEVLAGKIDEDRINASVVRIIENIIITGVDLHKIAGFIET